MRMRHVFFHPAFSAKGVKAKIAGRDAVHELALFRLHGRKLSPLPLCDSADVREGEGMAFTGYPIGLVLGLNPTTHTGIISPGLFPLFH